MSHSYYEPTQHGDVLSRLNLFRFIREHLYHSGVSAGTYLEFGVFNGDSMWDAHAALRGFISHYVGFDSFAGLPSLDANDQAAVGLMPNWAEGTVRGGSRQQVFNQLVSKGIPKDQLTLHEGFYEDALPKIDRQALAALGPCHVCLVDCDLYSSSKVVFEFIEPLLVEGTWLLLDDYFCYRGSPRHGQRRAFEEWLEHSRWGVTEWGTFRGWGKAFLVHERFAKS
ncbi:TylF/MycF/NovP-related O-methyltransferase [Castellaniella ginsengisoli]|uniref:TylF/MycF/NovP-related O-methyltransferase n=1 Tax=Castellaniella ginsengisoli TaxID=546114 RepID=A0AB39ELD4_9BURK